MAILVPAGLAEGGVFGAPYRLLGESTLMAFVTPSLVLSPILAICLVVWLVRYENLMAFGYLLAAPVSLLVQISLLLQSHGISCTQTDETTVTHGRRTVDLITYECVDGSATVALGVEKRRGRDGADFVLIPNRRIFFLLQNAAEQLADRINSILLDNGADNKP